MKFTMIYFIFAMICMQTSEASEHEKVKKPWPQLGDHVKVEDQNSHVISWGIVFGLNPTKVAIQETFTIKQEKESTAYFAKFQSWRKGENKDASEFVNKFVVDKEHRKRVDVTDGVGFDVTEITSTSDQTKAAYFIASSSALCTLYHKFKIKGATAGVGAGFGDCMDKWGKEYHKIEYDTGESRASKAGKMGKFVVGNVASTSKNLIILGFKTFLSLLPLGLSFIGPIFSMMGPILGSITAVMPYGYVIMPALGFFFFVQGPIFRWGCSFWPITSLKSCGYGVGYVTEGICGIDAFQSTADVIGRTCASWTIGFFGRIITAIKKAIRSAIEEVYDYVAPKIIRFLIYLNETVLDYIIITLESMWRVLDDNGNRYLSINANEIATISVIMLVLFGIMYGSVDFGEENDEEDSFFNRFNHCHSKLTFQKDLKSFDYGAKKRAKHSKLWNFVYNFLRSPSAQLVFIPVIYVVFKRFFSDQVPVWDQMCQTGKTIQKCAPGYIYGQSCKTVPLIGCWTYKNQNPLLSIPYLGPGASMFIMSSLPFIGLLWHSPIFFGLVLAFFPGKFLGYLSSLFKSSQSTLTNDLVLEIGSRYGIYILFGVLITFTIWPTFLKNDPLLIGSGRCLKPCGTTVLGGLVGSGRCVKSSGSGIKRFGRWLRSFAPRRVRKFFGEKQIEQKTKYVKKEKPKLGTLSKPKIKPDDEHKTEPKEEPKKKVDRNRFLDYSDDLDEDDKKSEGLPVWVVPVSIIGGILIFVCCCLMIISCPRGGPQ